MLQESPFGTGNRTIKTDTENDNTTMIEQKITFDRFIRWTITALIIGWLLAYLLYPIVGTCSLYCTKLTMG